ncbi:hypothetical protein HPB49_022277 [Dermacentor silvarum]|uniref:Uncharacterized protein n=1 Tax=Dermacentor silvarum TaxID=543639 RepID=A0ACB8E3R9_DERSI|nr:hypothetical protein HPB49_022277 [Dermacentor silvarum]
MPSRSGSSTASTPSGAPVSSLAGCSGETNLEIPEAYHSPILIQAGVPRLRRLQGDGEGGTGTPIYFPEQQTGFRRNRCKAYSISDVVATLEDAKAMGDVSMLVLLDGRSAFDGLPHAVIEACLDRLGLNGCLMGFISAFLTGRTFRPFPVQRGSRGPSRMPAADPVNPRFPVRCYIYADDVAHRAREPRKSMTSIRCSLQRALDAVTACLGRIGLTISTAKT